MSAIGNFFLIKPQDWIFPSHGDVVEGKKRAKEWFEKHGTYEGAEFYIEEFVRQWALIQLFNAYQYPRDWIGERIIIEEPVKMGSTEKEADISIKNVNRRTFLYIEVKKRGVSEQEFKEAERQLETYLASTHTATIGLVTDGDRVRTLRKKIDPNDFDYIADLPAYGLELKAKIQLVRELPDNANEDTKSTGLKILSNEYERVLFDCHSAARDVDGLHDDEALDEICKVIYTKIYDERQTTKQPEGTPFCFQTYGASNASEVASNIRVLYEEAKNADIEIYSKRIPDYERSRGVFKTQIRLSDTALYRVVERIQDFSLIDSKSDLRHDVEKDTSTLDPAVFDVVLTNPPFGSIMRQETMEMLGRFDLGHKKKSLPLEVIGLERSIQFLKPGGRMAIVLPEHMMKGKSAAFVRKWLYSVIHIRAIFFFPEEAFTPFGAMVKTCLCVFQKFKKGESSNNKDKTFLCEVENLGYEATGKPKTGSEVSDAISAFHAEGGWR